MIIAQLIMLAGLAFQGDVQNREVRVGVYVLDILSIDDVSQTVSADIHVRADWKVAKIAGTYKLGEIWNPQLVFLNAKDVRTDFPDTVTVDENGNATHKQRYRGEWTLPLNLQDFPFDSHLLAFQLFARGSQTEQFSISINQAASGSFEKLSLTGWSAEKQTVDPDILKIPGFDQELSGVLLQIPIKREPFFYLLRIIGPLILIVLMGWGVFWMDPKNNAGKLRLAASSFLTLTAFLLVIGGLLPKLSYLTRMDLFVAGHSLIIFFAVIISVAMDNYSAKEDRVIEARMTFLGRWGYLAGALLVTVFAFWM